MLTALWKRLDCPGHDACRLAPSGTGWQLEGAAAFRLDGQPAALDYRLTCDSAWRTDEGLVRGWIGAQPIELHIVRAAGNTWTLNGAAVAGLGECVDLDFGFTPATNLSQLRRLALAEGQAAAIAVAWLDVSARTLEVLVQRYERRTETTYWYEAPRFAYAACLEVDPSAVVRQYPGLWQLEP